MWRPKVRLGYCSGRTFYLDSVETGSLLGLALIHSATLVSEQTLGLTSACHHAWLFMWDGVGIELRSARLVAPSRLRFSPASLGCLLSEGGGLGS